MKWALSDLHRYQDEPLHINSTLDLNASLTDRFPETVLAATPVTVDGYLSYDKGDATLSTRVELVLTVPSSRSLAPVELPLNFTITETYLPDDSHRGRYEEEDQLVLTLGPSGVIDLDEIVMENIIEQVPLRVLTPAEEAAERLPEGKGWSMIDEATLDEEQTNQVDPRFAKLKNLFPDQDSRD